MNPFKLEKKRASLAGKNELSSLRLMYEKSFPQIFDRNNSSFWDVLNSDCTDYMFNNNPMALDRVKTVKGLIKGSKIKVLDVGFGSASLEETFFSDNNMKKNVQWAAIDISKKSVTLANSKLPFIKFSIGNILKLKFDSNTYDYVVSLEVLEHIQPSNLPRALSELGRVLKKNGKLIISVPLNEGLEELVSNGKNPNGHVRVYTPELIKAELRMNGFRIISEQYLYAFRSLYTIKKLLVKYIFKSYRRPNNIIVISQKP